MNQKIIIAGSGGQGVMLMGRILAHSAMNEGRFVTWLPAYGAEVRGGTAHCMVVISDKEIGSPFVEKADCLIVMNGPSLQKFKERIKNKGLLLLNVSLAGSYANKNINVIQHPFTDIANKLGNIRVANMVALGCLVAKNKMVDIKTIQEVFLEFAPPDKKELIEINRKALFEGASL